MKREKITISDSGAVSVPDEVRMNIGEIANLFGIFYQTAKRYIRAIEKACVASGDYSMSCTVEGQKAYPEYYGLDMIIAVAYRVHSREADVFRKWIYHRATHQCTQIRLTSLFDKTILN